MHKFLTEFGLELISSLSVVIAILSVYLGVKSKKKDKQRYRELLDIQDFYNYRMSNDNAGRYFLSNYDDRVLHELSRIRTELKRIKDDKYSSDSSSGHKNGLEYEELVHQIARMSNIQNLFEMLNKEKEDQYTYIKNVLADIVHTTRNPLSGIIAAVMVLKMNVDLDETVRETIQDIEKYVEEINTNMYVYQRISHISELNDDEDDIGDFEQELVDRCDLVAISQQKKVTLNKNIEKIEVDKHTTKIVLLAVACILENAVSYSPDNGIITIEAHVNGNELSIYIQNEGPIVEEAIMNKIFEQGFSTRKSSGRGLAIAKKCVEELLNGIVVCENIGIENGVRFSIMVEVNKENG